ncbi:asparagine synthase (glutamine-hydrolyzing) [Kyrpidia sp.]|uniref:asparagine synthase (glutamine-hydrolyzing) n=1 Tax=Kyrpidia sp. TaxID=2073077 RepID=UPI00258E77E5|nr:asparagine synthase (glutamine-hydrolyzing) [Kyrpidia sp.]MCL6576109.1 asparagine synthase (glutamine-hydrolyzing) [Kyrpidia sp.]
MCGIAGVIEAIGGRNEKLESILERMDVFQNHRGPDDHGVWVGSTSSVRIGLAHRRLAILDLSAAGRQPMVSSCGKYVLVFNGGLYNYKELRAELEAYGHVFKTRTDTEVVLQASIKWKEKALQKFNGMWALGWLDRSEGKFLLSRDRFGEKPLYWFWDRENHRFLFASEIKAILMGTRPHRFSLHLPAVFRYLFQSLLDGQPETLFEGIVALPAAHNMTSDLRDFDQRKDIEIYQYWQPSLAPMVGGNQESIIEEIRDIFIDSVRIRLRSDVPVGVLLSGGLDSSTIAAMANQLGDRSCLFSSVSRDPRFNEEPYMQMVASHLKQPLTKVELNINPHNLWPMLQEVVWYNDEPVGSLSNVAHYLLMKQAKDLGITVILSGQGADELLCGYKKYLGFYVQHLLRRGKFVMAAKVLMDFSRNRSIVVQFNLGEAKRYLPRWLVRRTTNIVGERLKGLSFELDVGLGEGDVTERQIRDLYQYSLPALVHYEDRMSMAHSREIRLPFLDYRLVDLLLPLSTDMKLHGGWTKWIFRKAMEPFLPKEVAWRKDKQGFVNPQSEWFKHELRDYTNELLADDDLFVYRSGLVNPHSARSLFAAYCSQPVGRGSINFRDVFNVLALESWLRVFERHLRIVD